jgi:sigma-B regulation protein RsbU (phosphoserine phosphatase)
MEKRNQILPSNTKEDVQSELDERLVELTSLFEVTRTLDASLGLKSILDHILLTAMGKMLIGKGSILLSRDGVCFQAETSKGIMEKDLESLTFTLDVPPTKWLLVEDSTAKRETWVSTLQKLGIVLILPMRAGGRTIGLVCFGQKPTGETYQSAEIDFLTSLTNIASTSVHNGLVAERLRVVNKRLDRKIQELNTLFDIGKELNSSLNPKKILQLLTYAVMGQMAINRSIVLVFREQSVEHSIAQGMKDINFETIDHRLLNRLTLISEPMNIKEKKGFKTFRSWGLSYVVPMRHQGVTRGIIGLGERIYGGPYTIDELEFLSTLANQGMIAIENARLFKEALEKERLEEELSIASRIQQGLLPKSFPKTERFDLAGLNIPSKQVGGDYYDFIPFDRRRIGIAIADVSGKGAPAALLMATLQAALRTLVGENKSIGEIMNGANNLAVQNTDIDTFITAVYGVLDIEGKTFTYSNAGHNPPFLVRADDTTELLDKGGLVLGWMNDVPYEEGIVHLRPNDRIVMFTDGVTEAMNANEDEFGGKRLLSAICEDKTLSAETLGHKIVQRVKSFSAADRQQDDITLVIIQCLGEKRGHR